MMGPFEMVVGIVFIATLGTIARTMITARHKQARLADDPEAARLRDEVKQLKERLAVLERITIEKENSLERQIESLRER